MRLPPGEEGQGEGGSFLQRWLTWPFGDEPFRTVDYRRLPCREERAYSRWPYVEPHVARLRVRLGRMSAPAAPAAHALDTGRSIVGRERELEVLVAWIDRGDIPLLTRTGEAGIGKTVLTEVAARHAL